MKRLLILGALLLAWAVPGRAQSGFTTVSATVKDPSSNLYAGAKGNASFVPSPTALTQSLLSGSTFQTDVPIVSIDSFANFTIVLADNNAISDGHTGGLGSQWRFNIVSQDGKTNFTCLLTITGTTQNITAGLQACAAPLPGTGGSGAGGVVNIVVLGTSTYPCSPAGLTAAIASLPSGGIIDGRGCDAPTPAITSTIAIPSNITIYLSPRAVWLCQVKCFSSTNTNNVKLIGLSGAGYAVVPASQVGTIFRANGGYTGDLVEFTSTFGAEIGGIIFDYAASAPPGGSGHGILSQANNNFYFHDIDVYDAPTWALEVNSGTGGSTQQHSYDGIIERFYAFAAGTGGYHFYTGAGANGDLDRITCRTCFYNGVQPGGATYYGTAGKIEVATGTNVNNGIADLIFDNFVSLGVAPTLNGWEIINTNTNASVINVRYFGITEANTSTGTGFLITDNNRPTAVQQLDISTSFSGFTTFHNITVGNAKNFQVYDGGGTTHTDGWRLLGTPGNVTNFTEATPSGNNSTNFRAASGNVALESSATSNTFIAQQNFDANTTFKGPNPWIDVTRYGVRAVNQGAVPNTTATITSGSPTATLAGASTFINGDGIRFSGAGATQSMSTPGAPTVTPSGSAGGYGVVANGLAGATTYNYQVRACDKGQGCTDVSSVGSTGTGDATLGVRTASITSMSRANEVTSVVCAATCGVAVGEIAYIAGTSPQDTSFHGMFVVDTVTDTTHFTFKSGMDTRAGATTASTGGTVQWYITNRVTWTAVSGAFRYFIYGRTGGSLTLIGMTRPLETFWDDYGSPFMDTTTFPDWVATTPAGAAATNDALVTTIVSGAGTTTVTLAANAGNNATTQKFIFDNAPNIKAAAVVATTNPGNPGTLYFPTTVGQTTVYKTNSYLNLASGLGTGFVTIWLAGSIQPDDTIELPGGAAIRGDLSGANLALASFGWRPAQAIGGSANPALYSSGTAGITLSGISVSANNGNQGTALVLDGNTNFSADYSQFSSGAAASDNAGIAVIVRGAFSFRFYKSLFNGGSTAATGATLYPAVVFRKQVADTQGSFNASFDHCWFVGRGVQQDWTGVNSGFNWIKMINIQTQSLRNPLLAFTGFNFSGGTYIQSITPADFATPVIANWGNQSDIVVKDWAQPTGAMNFVSGRVIAGLTMEGGGGASAVGQNRDISIYRSGNGSIPTYSSTSSTNNIATTEMHVMGMPLRFNGQHNIFWDIAVPTGVTATVSAGGSVPQPVSTTYTVTAIGIMGGESTPSLPSTACVTSSGNQTCTVNWTASVGAISYNVNRLGVRATSATHLTTTSYVDTFSSAAGNTSTNITGAGIIEIGADTNGVYRVVTPNLTLVPSVANGFKQSIVPPTLAADSTVTMPNFNTATVASLNNAQTFTAAQTFSTPIGISSGGTNATASNYSTNGAMYYDGTRLVTSATGGGGTLCFVSTAGGAPVFGSCSGSAATAWSSLTNPSASLSLSMGTNNSLFTSGVLTATNGAWEFLDGNSTSTGNFFFIHSGATSTIKPFTATAQGTANGVQMNTSGILAPIGTGGITANAFSGAVPIANGGTGQTTANAGFNALSPLTTAGDILYGGTAGAGTRLAPGTATQLLHSGTTPSWSAVSLTADVTGTLPIANGGSGQTTASAAFDAFSPTTTRGDLIARGASSNARIALGGNGTCLTSNGTDALWGSCAAGSVGGTAAATQGTFWNGTATVTGSANWTYAAASGHTVIQGANAADAFLMRRFTDTSPTGNFLRFRDTAATTDLFKVDVNGNVSAVSFTATGPCNGGTAGCQIFTQGTAPSTTASSSITVHAPTSVTDYRLVLPGVSSTGFLRGTNASNVNTLSFAAASGVGACSVTLVVTAVNDNAAPTCSPTTGAMFGSQSGNLVMASPNGSTGSPGFRALVGADIPAIALNGTGNGGVVGTLPINVGGTNATTVSQAFNNLWPGTTLGDTVYGGSAGAGTRLAGNITTTKQYLSQTGNGAVSAAPAWAQVAFADLSGTVSIAQGGTGQTTAGAAFNALAPAASANALIYATGTNAWGQLAAGGGGTLCLTETGGGTPTWGSCAGSASTVWSALTNPSASLSLSMGTNNSLFTSGVLTGTNGAWEFLDGNSTSTGNFFYVHSGATSTAKPVTFTAQGTANGVQMDTTGLLAAIGTGGIKSTTSSQSISTNSPLGGGGAFTGNLTLTCATCVTSSSGLSSNALIIGSGGGQGTATASGLTTDGTSVVTLGVAGTSAGGIDFKNATSGTLSVRVPTGALGTVTVTLPDATDTLMGKATTDVKTNLTLDAEGTGNVITEVDYVSFSPACNNATAGPGSFNVPTSAAATFTCSGTTTTQGNADFVDGSTTSLTTEAYKLPTGWTGNVDIDVSWWANAASSNAVRWSVSNGCVADSEAVNTGPSYNSASASNTAYTGTANQKKTTSFTSVSVTNCAADESIYFQIQRIGGDGGDTLAATAELIEMRVKQRKTK